MNLRTIGLFTLLAILLFITARVLADVKTERIKIKISDTFIEKVVEVAGTVNGVIHTKWDEDTGELEIVFDQNKTNLQQIEQTISEAGFETPNYKASEEESADVSQENKKIDTSIQ